MSFTPFFISLHLKLPTLFVRKDSTSAPAVDSGTHHNKITIYGINKLQRILYLKEHFSVGAKQIRLLVKCDQRQRWHEALRKDFVRRVRRLQSQWVAAPGASDVIDHACAGCKMPLAQQGFGLATHVAYCETGTVPLRSWPARSIRIRPS